MRLGPTMCVLCVCLTLTLGPHCAKLTDSLTHPASCQQWVFPVQQISCPAGPHQCCQAAMDDAAAALKDDGTERHRAAWCVRGGEVVA